MSSRTGERKLDPGRRVLMAEAPANSDAQQDSAGCQTSAGRGAVCIGGKNAACEKWHGLDKTEPQHLLALCRRETSEWTLAAMRDNGRLRNAATPVCVEAAIS